jgi:putative ABC transport system permease protein
MSPRWKKVWADFWQHKTRSVLIILTIAVGVFAVGFVDMTGAVMMEDMDLDFNSSNPSEALIYAYPLQPAYLDRLERLAGVGELQLSSQIVARLLQQGDQYTTIQFLSIPESGQTRLNRLQPEIPGGILPVLKKEEILLDRSVRSLGFQPGDILQVELSDGSLRALRLVGYIHDVTAFPYAFSGVASAYVTPETIEWLGGPLDYNLLALSVAENPTDQDHVEAVAQAVSDDLEKSGVSVNAILIFNPGRHFSSQVADGVFLVLGTLGWLSVFLSIFLIINMISSLMSQQVRYIGIMKAIGARTRQVFLMYLVLVLFFGVCAFAIAAPLAIQAGYMTGLGMGDFLNIDIGPLRSYPNILIKQAVLALLVPLLAALLPMTGAVRQTVRDAISSYGVGKGRFGSSWIDRLVERVTFLSRPMLISLRNAFRRKARLVLTLTTLSLAGAIFIAVFNLWASFDQTMRDVQGYFLADINVGLSQLYRFDKVAGLAQGVPGVQSVEGWSESRQQLLASDGETKTEILMVAPPSSSTLIQPMITDGRWLQPSDENALVIGNHLLKVHPQLKVGDTVQIEVDGQKTGWKIVGIFRMPGNASPPIVYANYEYVSRLLHEPGMIFNLRVLTSDHDPLTQAAASSRLQELFKQSGIQFSAVTLSSEWIAQQEGQTDVLVYNMLVMAILTAVVGGLGLMSTMSINVMERTREIGVMRAVGASNGAIRAVIIVETLVVGLLSWLIGLLLSIPITGLLVNGVGMAVFQAPLPFMLGWKGLIAWIFVVLFVSVFASLAPAWRASRLTVREVLAYE